MNFNDWVKTHVFLPPGGFTSVKELYAAYKETNDPKALITEDLFYKEIEWLIFGLNIKPGRSRGKQGRNFLNTHISPYYRRMMSFDIKLNPDS